MGDIYNISASIQNIINSVALITPELTIVAGFLLVILIDLFVKQSRTINFYVALSSIILAMLFFILQYKDVGASQVLLFNNMFVINKKIILFKILSMFAAALSLIFFSLDKRLSTHRKGIGDLYSVFLASLLAVLILISSANLLLAFIAIEMLSLASYIMVVYSSEDEKQTEAGMKYLLFGTAVSAMMLYGITFIYGFSGSLNLYDASIINGLNEVPTVAKTMALIFFMAGIGFKLSFVPFHFWTPDAYQAAPTSVTSFLSTLPKIAVFAWLLSINDVLHLSADIYIQLIFAVALLTLLLGNVMAIFQKDLKRLMAYSAIGHTGFMLMIYILPGINIFNALFFYLLVYVITNVGVFAVLYFFEEKYGAVTLEAIKGLGKPAALAGSILVLFAVSLIGLPPTGGFVAKFVIFSELISHLNHSVYNIILLIVAVLTTVISLFYYFKIPLNLFLRKAEINIEPSPSGSNHPILVLAMVLAVFILILGVAPNFFSFM